ncbi:MAG: 50S ribosomal protein L3 [Firmicutes bacterium]|nr:50S ribosomal protein L3 [Bacillota bacterium]
MPKGILGRKLGMTQIFTETGELLPVTVIEATPNSVIQVKSQETDGYESIQVGFGEKREKLLSKPEKGHLAKAGAKGIRYLREFRSEGVAEFQDLKVGDTVGVDIFKAGELVDVTGTTKGKGFAGVIKRWGYARGPMAHGSKYHRGVGSLGATGPARVFKGRKLPGRMGNVRRTIQGLEIVRVDQERNLLLVKGGVPGVRGSLVRIQASVKSAR